MRILFMNMHWIIKKKLSEPKGAYGYPNDITKKFNNNIIHINKYVRYCNTYLAKGLPWSWRWFPHCETCPLHLGRVDLCDCPKCGQLGSVILDWVYDRLVPPRRLIIYFLALEFNSQRGEYSPSNIDVLCINIYLFIVSTTKGLILH